MPKNANVYDAFKIGFKAARDEVYRRCNNKFPLNDVIDMMVEAAYQNLIDAVTGKLIMEGKTAPAQAQERSPKVKIRDRELATVEILELMGTDLSKLDTKHEYSVGILKRERRTEPL
jgi:hypothetical protein